MRLVRFAAGAEDGSGRVERNGQSTEGLAMADCMFGRDPVKGGGSKGKESSGSLRLG